MTDWLKCIRFHIMFIIIYYIYKIPNLDRSSRTCIRRLMTSMGSLHLNLILTPSSDGQFIKTKWILILKITTCPISLAGENPLDTSYAHVHACRDLPPCHSDALNSAGLKHCLCEGLVMGRFETSHTGYWGNQHLLDISFFVTQSVLFSLGQTCDWQGRPYTPKQGFCAKYVIFPWKDICFCPNVNLRELNWVLKTLPFSKVVIQAVQEHDWFTLVDLCGAYFHVCISAEQRCLSFLFFKAKHFNSKFYTMASPYAAPWRISSFRTVYHTLTQHGAP